MDAWDALTARRQTREYAVGPVATELVDRVLDAARRSPSGHNSQPWHFVVVTEEDTKAGLSQTWQGAHWVAGAPVVVAVLASRRADEAMARVVEYDIGQAVSSMLVAATDLGLASGQSAVVDQDAAQDLLGYPDDVYCSKLVTLGHPLAPLAPVHKPDRRHFDDVVHRERWQS